VLTLLSETERVDVTNGSTAAPFGAALAAFGAMVLLAYGLPSVAFWAEVKKARSLLCEALGVGDSDVQEN
jgi:hypothetical protein